MKNKRLPDKQLTVHVYGSKYEADKKAANAAGDKRVELLPVKELLSVTGYIRGGCSPVGMKKKFPSFIDETATLFDTITVSAGVRGAQLELNPTELVGFLDMQICDIARQPGDVF